MGGLKKMPYRREWETGEEKRPLQNFGRRGGRPSLVAQKGD